MIFVYHIVNLCAKICLTLQTCWIESKCIPFFCRYPSLQVWAVRESFHTALLSGVPHEENSWRSPAVRLPPKTLQDLCLWRLWLHFKPSRWIFPARETTSPRQSCASQILPSPSPWKQHFCIDWPQTHPLCVVFHPHVLHLAFCAYSYSLHIMCRY